jgi:hypothetical protein
MKIPAKPTYILEYTPRTLTAIARAEKACQAGQNIQHDVDVTTDEDRSVHKPAKGWRTISKDEGDRFIVEVEPGVPSSQFDLPFYHAVNFADEAQKNLSKSYV